MTGALLVWDDGYEQREQDSPTWADISARVSELDGAVKTLVTIYRGESHLAVGGSVASGLVVYCTYDNDVFWQLLGENNSNAPVSVVAGGQVGAYPTRHVAGLSAALVAAEVFSESGTLALSLRWES